MPIDFTETECRIAILQVALSQKQKMKQGVSARMVRDILETSLSKVDDGIVWLLEKRYIHRTDRYLSITDAGVAYLTDTLGTDEAPPTSPPKVPNSPLPASPSAGLALRQPEEDSNSNQ